MPEKSLDVLSIGNAIVDVLARTTDAFLEAEGMDKDSMILIDATRAEELYGRMGPAHEVSGGSAANTAAGLANLGARTAFIGRVRNDQLGQVFAHDIRAQGVRFESKMTEDGPPTARSFILVTPDGHRTMNTYLGACVELSVDDIDAGLVQSARYIHIEGYLFDPPGAREACLKAMEIAKKAGVQVSVSLADSFCVERHLDLFEELARTTIDVLFANEAEIKALYRVESFDAALQTAKSRRGVSALTRSAKGSVTVQGDDVHVIDAAPVAQVADTTGAGDLYASGFLFGLLNGVDLASCARMAGLAAAEVISHLGARPETDLKALMAPVLAEARSEVT